MRPDGWENPFKDDSERVGMRGYIGRRKYNAHEAGADAMLGGLLNSAESYHPNSGILKDKLKKHSFPKGRLVFIPEA